VILSFTDPLFNSRKLLAGQCLVSFVFSRTMSIMLTCINAYSATKPRTKIQNNSKQMYNISMVEAPWSWAGKIYSLDKVTINFACSGWVSVGTVPCQNIHLLSDFSLHSKPKQHQVLLATRGAHLTQVYLKKARKSLAYCGFSCFTSAFEAGPGAGWLHVEHCVPHVHQRVNSVQTWSDQLYGDYSPTNELNPSANFYGGNNLKTLLQRRS
jgi:hypothetical protein